MKVHSNIRPKTSPTDPLLLNKRVSNYQKEVKYLHLIRKKSEVDSGTPPEIKNLFQQLPRHSAHRKALTSVLLKGNNVHDLLDLFSKRYYYKAQKMEIKNAELFTQTMG